DLTQKALGAQRGGEHRAQYLDGDLAAVLQILGQENSRHPAASELALQRIAFGQSVSERAAGARDFHFAGLICNNGLTGHSPPLISHELWRRIHDSRYPVVFPAIRQTTPICSNGWVRCASIFRCTKAHRLVAAFQSAPR